MYFRDAGVADKDAKRTIGPATFCMSSVVNLRGGEVPFAVKIKFLLCKKNISDAYDNTTLLCGEGELRRHGETAKLPDGNKKNGLPDPPLKEEALSERPH